MRSRRRDEPHLFNLFGSSWEPLSGPAILHGVDASVVTQDERTGAATYTVRLPAGWRQTTLSDEATIEVFVLRGDLAAEGDAVGTGGFVALPRGTGSCELASTRGADAIVFWNPVLDPAAYYGDGPHVTRLWREPWIPAKLPGIQHGIMHKYLRWPDTTEGGRGGGPDGILRVAMLAPGFGEPRQEVHHANWEEMIFLTGDFLMPERGFCGPGTVLSNPAGLRHGPLITQRGSMMLYHTDAPATVEFHHADGGEEVTAHYLDTAPFFDEPATEPWAERPEVPVWEEARRLPAASG